MEHAPVRDGDVPLREGGIRGRGELEVLLKGGGQKEGGLRLCRFRMGRKGECLQRSEERRRREKDGKDPSDRLDFRIHTNSL